MYAKSNKFVRVAVHLILLNCASKLSLAVDGKKEGILFHDRVIYEMSETGPLSWPNAFVECRAKGIDLLTINTFEELTSINWIVDHSITIPDKDIWTSGRYIPSLREFHWITTGNLVTEFQVDGDINSCLSIRYGTPTATLCNTPRYYFCEEPIDACKHNLSGKKAVLCYKLTSCKGNK